jgi:hypothetical protein
LKLPSLYLNPDSVFPKVFLEASSIAYFDLRSGWIAKIQYQDGVWRAISACRCDNLASLLYMGWLYLPKKSYNVKKMAGTTIAYNDIEKLQSQWYDLRLTRAGPIFGLTG